MKFVPKENFADKKQIEYISKKYDVCPVIAEILIARGIADNLDDFLGDGEIYDSMLLNDMKKSMECIRAHINNGSKITVYGDYDVDGVCASSILYLYFKKIGANVNVFLPDRHIDGYGLNCECIKNIANTGTQLLITVDCGISNAKEVEYAKSLGLDVIVTDHHQCPEILPQCEGVINPLIGDYPFKLLCGSGIALKLVMALGGNNELYEYSDLAAVATVSDLVQLTGENRSIVKIGLKKINSENNRIGLSAICTKSGLKNEIESGHIAFGIGPRINASGRMANASEAFNLLVCDDYDSAAEMANTLNKYNDARKKEEAEIYNMAVDSIEKTTDIKTERIITVCGKGWNKGVIGIVASKLVERYYRPVIVFSEEDGVCVGSGRSIPGIHLFNLINHFGNDFIKYGGHEMAAGMSVYADKIKMLCKKLKDYVEHNFGEELFIPTISYDAELELSDITKKLAEDIQMLAPMGMGNKTPVFRISDVEINSPRLIGNEQNHIKMNIVKGNLSLDGVAFSMGERISEIKDGCKYDIIAGVEKNSWENREYIQLQIKELKPNIITGSRDMVKNCGEQYFDSLVTVSELQIEAVNRNRIRQMWNWEIYLSRRLKKDVLGTAIYTSIPTCTYELMNYLSKENLEENVDFFVGRPGKNSCVVLAPDWDADKLDYSRLVIFDYAPTDFVNRVLEKNKNIQIVICHNDFTYNCLQKFVMSLDFERDKAKMYYSIINNICKPSAQKDVVIDNLCKLGNETVFNGYFALGVFNELGLINIIDNKVSIAKNEGKKDLSTSNYIKDIYSLKDRIFKELDLIIPPREYKGKKR